MGAGRNRVDRLPPADVNMPEYPACGADRSRETAERLRCMVHGRAEPTRSVPLGVFEFTQDGPA